MGTAMGTKITQAYTLTVEYVEEIPDEIFGKNIFFKCLDHTKDTWMIIWYCGNAYGETLPINIIYTKTYKIK